jgi:phosphate transport system ATP-binding protein
MPEPTSGAPILEARQFNMSISGKHILKDIDAQFPQREITALIGPSGCGKSTFLRAFNRMHDLLPSFKYWGELCFNGINLYGTEMDVTDVRRRLGMVFQRPNPFPKTIFENVAYGLKIGGGLSRSQIKQKVEQSLKEAALWEEVKDYLNQSALSLSGGQQQRLCIARAIAIEPEVLMMDEPCSALDPLSTEKVEQLMLRLKENYTIVLVTHNMQQAQRVSDNTGFMYLGEMIELRDTHTIFSAPEKELTRKYIEGNFG